MNEKDISLLLQKADELRSLFVLGQRVIPFLEEIFVFVRDIQPMINEISASINDNLQKMPGASDKLSKVTEANELATTEIMNIVDNLFTKVTDINDNREIVRKHNENIIQKPLRLLEIVHKGIQQGSDLNEILPQLAQSINTLNAYSTENIKPVEAKTDEILDSIINDASAIMMSLQVQDITAQQIAAVDHMLRAIQTKMAGILKHFAQTDLSSLAREDEKIKSGGDEDNGENITHFHRDIAFDPNAIDAIEQKETRQSEIDELMAAHLANPDEEETLEATPNEPASADDIDAMFASPSAEPETSHTVETATVETATVETEQAPNEPASADDIDAMFGNVNTDEPVEEESVDTDAPASADDIDAMFGNANTDEPASTDDIDAMFASANDDEAASSDDIDAMFAK